jgi:hypothetical protein
VRRNVVFISAGSFAFGECVLALNFARGLSPSRYRACFIVSPVNEPLFGNRDEFDVLTLFREAPGLNAILVSDFLERFPPDLFVLCDFLTFEHAAGEHGIGIDYLRGFGKPILSLDSYEWESGDFVLDFLAGIRKPVSRLLQDLDGGLRPCPLNKPRGLEARSACYSFFRQLKAPDLVSRREVREQLGVPAGHLLFVSAVAPWESLATRQIPPGPFRQEVPQRIERYVSLLGMPVSWFRIGASAGRTTETRGHVAMHDLPGLPAGEFDELLFAADLLISTNIASTTLAKRSGYNRPALFLYNSVSAEIPFPIRPYRMFPMGWYDFLGPVVRGNPYLDTFHSAEVLDEERAVTAMRKAIAEDEGEIRMKRAVYRDLLDALPLPDDCVDHFLC